MEQGSMRANNITEQYEWNVRNSTMKNEGSHYCKVNEIVSGPEFPWPES